MKWKVEISNFAGDIRMLREVLEPLSIAVSGADGKLFMAGQRFEDMRSAVEVHADATEVSAIISENAAADPEIKLAFGIGVIIDEGLDGTSTKHTIVALVSTAQVASSAGIVRVSTTSGPVSETERAGLEEERREREHQRVTRKAIARVVSAARNPNAREVQRILRGELTPHTMWHIVELIEADGAIKALGISRNQLGRLTGSINHPDVYGKDARHRVREHEPPPIPMELEEARAFIHDVANRWFERIAGI